MKKMIWLSILLIAAFTLNGCAGNKLIRDKDNRTSLVFGYVDMDDAPVDLDWLAIKQVLPKTDKPYLYEATDHGMFWGSFFKKGAYQIDGFGGRSILRRTDYEFDLPKQYARKLRFKVGNKPAIYFMGSYKYKDVKTGFFEPGKFDFVATKSPSEKELLERLLKYTDSKIWEARIKHRIMELSK